MFGMMKCNPFTTLATGVECADEDTIENTLNGAIAGV